MRSILLMLALLAVPPEFRITVHLDRDSGYVTGDLLTVEAEVHAPDLYRLEPRSVEEGALPEWLELRSSSWSARPDPTGTTYRIRWIYQLFFVPDLLQRLEIPPRPLRFRHPDRTVRLLTPPLSVLVAPLTDLRSSLQPDWQPPPPSTTWIRLELISLAVLSALLALTLAIRRRREDEPVLSRAHRAIQRASTGTEALVLLHRALDEKAGEALFPGRLDVLLARCPELRALRTDLEAFFAYSEAVFYRDTGPPPEVPVQWVRELASRLARLERRGRRGPWSSRIRPT